MHTWALWLCHHHPSVFLVSLFALLMLQFFIHSKYTLNEHWDSWKRGRQGFVTARVSCLDTAAVWQHFGLYICHLLCEDTK